MDHPFQSPAVISFCPGILGLERGLERAGTKCRVMAYVEIEAFIIANLVAGMESGVVDPAPIWTDAKTFDALPFRGRIHGIIGGYPCPGESLAGLREKHLYKGFIWPAIRRAINAARPLWCFFENVDDHLTGTFPIVHRSLRNMGYAVEVGIFTAEEVGAPHERQRLFILAIHKKAMGHAGYHMFQTSRDFGKKKTEFKNEQASNELVHINRERKQISPERKFSTEQFIKWPAAQGSYQYEYEQPRTIKPGMGCTVHGYNFREDIIRALGNSVVEQTAELAFTTLLHKHGITI